MNKFTTTLIALILFTIQVEANNNTVKTCNLSSKLLLGNPPIANFQANVNRINQGETINFTNLSTNSPSSYAWSFPGGSPSSSNIQNPSIQYSSGGSFDVTLIVTNAFGSDTIIKPNYISVANTYNMCSTSSSSSDSIGTLFDSGGPLGNYSNSQSCSFLINPACANSITLSFSQFRLEGCCDYFRVYDGPNTSGALLLSANGSSLPSSITANSGQMYITFSSDYSVTYSGWAASWTAQVANSKPTANFNVSSINPPFATHVFFQDQTTVYPNAWEWSFGDGSTSTLQNPSHKYMISGNYSPTLISTNCTQSDTISKSITVQSPPQISIDSSKLRATVACGDSIDLSYELKNLSGGELVYETSSSSQSSSSQNSTLDVLAMTLGADVSGEYTTTINAINQYFNNYSLTPFGLTDSASLRASLSNKDLLLIPEIEYNFVSDYLNFTNVIQDFVSNGGEVVFCGTGNLNAIIFNTGLFSGSYNTSLSSGTPLVKTNPNHYLLDSIPSNIFAQSATYSYNITDANKQTILSYSIYDVVVTRSYGQGIATLIGFDYYTYSIQTARIIANSFKLAAERKSNTWLYTTNATDTINAGDSTTISVRLSAENIFSGTYLDTIQVSSNDSLNSIINIPITFTVTGDAIIYSVRDTVNFNQAQVGSTTFDTLTIFNQGCDSLHIDSITFSNLDFTNNYNSIQIPPFDKLNVGLQFSPTSIQNYYDSLIIHTPDTTKIVSINAVSIGAPSVSYNPISISDTIFNCQDSITVPLTIYNSGQGALNIKITNKSIANTNFGSKQALLIKDRNAWGGNVNYSILTNMGVSTTTINSSQIASTNFNNYDLIVLESNQYASFYNTYLSQISKFDNYLFNGGAIHFCNTSYLGLQFPGGSLTTSNVTQYNNQNFVVNPSHPLHDSCSGPYTGSSASHNYFTNLPSNGASILIENTSNLPTAVEVKYGTGTMLAYGMPLEYIHYYNYNCTKLIENSFKYLLNSTVDWLNIASDSASIPIGDSATIDLTLNGKNLINGTYSTNLFIESNDPLSNFDTIPITMYINALAELVVDTSINFQTTTQYVQVTDSVLIQNNGCDTLNVTNIISTSPVFSTDTNNFSLAPNDSIWLFVRFTPTLTGTFNDTLTLINDLADTSIQLSGISLQAPEITISPKVLYDTISNCGDSSISNFTIYNSGGNSLNWSIVNDVSVADDFESVLNYNLWHNTSGTLTNSCGTNSGASALYFRYGPRYAETVNFDFRHGGNLEFYLKYAASNYPCETLDNGEEVSLQYSIDNGLNWTTISTYQRTAHLGSFALVQETIPQIAQTANTKLRWIQLNYSGSNNDHWALDDIIVTNHGLDSFITSIQADSGQVLSNDSSVISINFNSSRLNAGNYAKTIYINSNDPMTPLDSVELLTTVIGSPGISLSDSCLKFGTLLTNGDKTDSLMITNPGCENLIISGTIIGSSSYSLISYPDTLLPYDTAYITVKFNPSIVGSHNSYLRLFNNANDTSICLEGNSLPAPIIDLYPDSIQLSIRACVDSVTLPIAIRNTGGSDLTYSIVGNRNDTIEILALTYGADYYEEYTNTKQALNSQLSKYHLTELNSTDSNTIQNALQNIDVVLIPEIENGFTSLFTNYAPPLQRFVSNGGSVIFCGSYGNKAQAIFNTGLFSGSYQTNNTTTINSFSQSHPIIDSVPTPFSTPNGTFAYTFTNPNIVRLLSYAIGQDIIAYRTIGLGKAIYIGFDFYTYNQSTSIILANAIQWGHNNAIPSWLNFNTFKDTVIASDSSIISTTIYGKDLSIGSQSYNLIIESNDPANDRVEFPINVNVIGTPCADFDYNILNVCNGTISFSDSTENSPTGWTWYFGDGSAPSSQQNPTHTYSSAGIYSVTLISSNGLGNDTTTKTITINKMVADFTIGSPLIPNQFISFTSNSPGAISWNWSFGNGASGSGQSLSYSYPLPGNYNVTLVATNGFGCKDTITKLVQIIAVGLEENSLSDFELWPNPNNGHFTIKTINENPIEEIKIFNSQGKIVYHNQMPKKANKLTVNLEQNAKGIYLVRIAVKNNGIIERKIIIH